jgi:serine/threonine-protein kinase
MTTCPSPDALLHLGIESGDGSCPPGIATHIERCPECRAFLERRGEDGLESLLAATASLPAPEAPPRVAGFTIDHEIGRGAMGVVYLARRDAPKRPVALKLLPGGRRANSHQRRRWLREAEAASLVRHPNVVTLYDSAETDDWFLLVLEYIPGGTLADQLAQPLAPAHAARLVDTLARAVHHVHLCGKLHLDLKPSNILLDGDTELGWDAVIPKISDFGIAWSAESTATDTCVPGPGGTPSYMAPEQIRTSPQEMTAAADIHGLGAILYHLLTGRPPYLGATLLETIDLLQRHELVPPRRLNPRIPRDLETICLKCLEKDPCRRYPSAESLADDLSRWINGRPISARPVSSVEKSWRCCLS